MAKMRVYEIAKELDASSKEILDFLQEKGVEAKTASSNIDDDAIAMVKGRFSAGANGGKDMPKKPESKEAVKDQEQTKESDEKKPEEKKQKPAMQEKGEEAFSKAPAKPSEKPVSKPAQKPVSTKPAQKASEKTDAPAKKKSSITAVFNAQYTKNGAQGGRRDQGGVRKPRRPEGASSFTSQSAPGIRKPIRPRSADERVIRPRGMDNAPDYVPVPPKPVEKPAPAPKEEVKKAPEQETAPVISQDQKIVEHTEEKPKTIVRENIYANHPERLQNGKPSSFGKDQKDQKGQRPQGSDKDRRNGQQKGRDNDRRPMSKNQGAAAAQKGSVPEQSGRKGGFSKDRKKNAGNADYDALGSKKQERFVNLERKGRTKHHAPSNKAPERNMEELMSIIIPEHITVKELAEKMMVKPTDVVKDLFMKGKMVTLNSDLKFEEAEELALEYNCIVEREEKEDVIANLLMEEDEDEKDQVPRPPVVCVMGHVDHGKTSLLDAIRDTRVTDREAGGITQKIGAYVVSVKDRKITFLDTPGHEAFTAMRMRGAKSTDIAILVVAADDGVMPQTVEAINHAKAAGVEIIVAVNKIDKPNANVERVKQELSEYELIPEDWGGSTIFVPVSAHTHEGIDDLLDMILLTADVLELKANPKRNVRGVVIEAELDKGRGVVATVLVQKGTLHVGDPVACGPCYGKVRAMTDEYGKHLKKVGPSMPVEIQGLSAVPTGGEIFMSFDSEKEAHSFAETFIAEEKKSLIDETRSRMSLDGLFTKIQEGKVKELDIIVKADVQGSVEAVKQSLEKLSNEEVVVKVIHGGVGAINESDVTLAAASNAVIIGFNVRPDAVAKQTAETQGVDIRLYTVIYNAIEDVEDAMKGMLEPVFEEKVTGHAEVRQIFKSSGVGNIAGSIVTDGVLERDCGARIFRGDDMIYEGKLVSLKRFKDDVKEVKSGFECGLVFENFGEFLEGDRIECYKMVEVPRS